MSVGKKVWLYCQACGTRFLYNFIGGPWDGRVCSERCWNDWQTYYAESITGTEVDQH